MEKVSLNLLTNCSENQEDTRIKEEVAKILNGAVAVITTIGRMCDPYTASHQQRVSQLACAIGEKLSLTEFQIQGIRVAGLLHDIGKIAVPNTILTKYGAINDYEFGIIKNHPKNGYKILSKLNFPWPISKIVLQHHERIDGSGYPIGLFDHDILFETKVIAVADVVEAICSHRPYRNALGIEQAISEIYENRGTLYDDDVVRACLNVLLDDKFEFDQKYQV